MRREDRVASRLACDPVVVGEHVWSANAPARPTGFP